MSCSIDSERWKIERVAKILRLAVDGTSGRSGQPYFHRLAHDLAEAFEMRACLLTECLDSPPTRVATLGFWTGDENLGRYEYELRGTPCEEVVGDRECVHPREVQGLFPDDFDLVKLGAQSYVAVPMKDFMGRVIGHIALLGDHPLTEEFAELPLLRVFAQQIACELERRRAEARQRDRERRLHQGYRLDRSQLERLGDQLLKARRVAIMGRMASRVAHDFNNLLTGILGYGDLLLWQLPPDQPSRKACEEIVAAAQRGAALTSQVMAFGRPPESQLRYVDLNQILCGLEPLLQRVLPSTIKLQMELASDVATVFVDPGQIELIVMDLAANAQDAMPQGGRLLISTGNLCFAEGEEGPHPELEPGGYASLAVSDTGIGMSAKVREQIFEPFFTTKKDAVGLGLSAVRNLVRLSGGEIAVESRPVAGSRFTIYLPHQADPAVDAEGADAEGAAASEPSPSPDPPRVETSRKPNETVLIAEDQSLVRQLVRRVLETRGYRILDAGDASEALEVASRHSGTIDLLITDVVMPGDDGRVLADKLRRLRPDLKVLFMSGHNAERLLRHGINGDERTFLQKPFTEKSLIYKVEELLAVS